MEQIAKKVSMVDAIHLMSKAWRSVKTDTIKNYFTKALNGGDLEFHEEYPTCTRTEEALERIVRTEDSLLAQLEESQDLLEDDEGESSNVLQASISSARCLEILSEFRMYCQHRNFPDEIHE